MGEFVFCSAESAALVSQKGDATPTKGMVQCSKMLSKGLVFLLELFRNLGGRVSLTEIIILNSRLHSYDHGRPQNGTCSPSKA